MSNLQYINGLIYMDLMTCHYCNLDCVGLGAKPQRWAPLTCYTWKGISWI